MIKSALIVKIYVFWQLFNGGNKIISFHKSVYGNSCILFTLLRLCFPTRLVTYATAYQLQQWWEQYLLCFCVLGACVHWRKTKEPACIVSITRSHFIINVSMCLLLLFYYNCFIITYYYLLLLCMCHAMISDCKKNAADGCYYLRPCCCDRNIYVTKVTSA